MGVIIGDSTDTPAAAAPKQRDAVFDVAKGLAILVVLGHHSSSNVARLYTAPHSISWWGLNFLNRILSFSVPAFLVISAILSARTLIKRPAVLPFYGRRLPAILWPYLVWTAVYWLAYMVAAPSSAAPRVGRVFGYELTGPAYLMHFKDRLRDVIWGKAYFHMYFMVVLFELIILLPLAVAYVRWRKPGFWEIMATALVIQGAIMVAQHYTRLMPYPGSNALWYIGSLLPGAWIGANWEEFRAKQRQYVWPLVGICVVTLILFLREELKVIHRIEADNYLSNGSLTIYASCISILLLTFSESITKRVRWCKVLEPLGRTSLQIYLIHPGVMEVMERHAIAGALLKTHLGVILAPMIMFSVTIGIIALMRVTRIEKAFFGRS